ncbi:antitoxin [Gordonia sputi]
MDLKGLVDKAKEALRGNPSLIDKGGDAIDKATGGKYADKVDKAQDAARKAVGVEGDKPAQQNPAPQNQNPQNPAPQNPAPQNPAEQKPANEQQPPANG